MFVQVRLLNGYSQSLLYQVPETYSMTNLVGTIVAVPLRNRIEKAVVVQTLQEPPGNSTFTIKEIAGIEPFPADPYYQNYITKLSHYYQTDPWYFNERLHYFLVQETKKERKKKTAQIIQSHYKPITLTQEQQSVYDFAATFIDKPAYAPILLHGVTGSGKTEVYKSLILKAIAARKTVILLLPEVTLALQFERLMRKQLPEDVTIIGFHSATPASEKRALWQRLLKQEPTLIIGVHLPILLPVANLGLIIIDEEHEAGYQEKKHPKINTKDAAIWRAHGAQIPILLGSATPSISSLYNVKTKHWRMFQMKQRFTGILPTIQTVYLTDKKQRKNFWISEQLAKAIQDRLDNKEQTIIFLNRRGFSFFVQCKSCSYIFSCTNCSVSLTLHTDDLLTCHYCGIGMYQPTNCPQCKTTDFLRKGIGTQQIVSILEKLFPQAKIGRADLDVTAKKKVWQQTVRDFEAGSLDILVGTQTITKGFHFPKVTLVGIIWADLNLNFPIFNASETTIQQLIQVAGRAGRASNRSTVIVQAMGEHPIFQYLNEIDYLTYYEQEIELRATVGYPPCMRLAELELKQADEHIVEREAHDIAMQLQSIAQQKQYSSTILGPAKPPVSKIKNTHARKIYVKSESIEQIIALFCAVKKVPLHSKLFFTPNPLR